MVRTLVLPHIGRHMPPRRHTSQSRTRVPPCRLRVRSFCSLPLVHLDRERVSASALVPMAQIKPSSSRPTAVTIFLLSLPLAASLAYRLCSRFCAFHAISLASSDALCCRLRNPAQMAGGR